MNTLIKNFVRMLKIYKYNVLLKYYYVTILFQNSNLSKLVVPYSPPWRGKAPLNLPQGETFAVGLVCYTSMFKSTNLVVA
jgi:hypothetical protein